jgi:hypothetical protein
LVLAWVASNGPWADVPAPPVPPELQPEAVTLAPADNAFFDGQGLRAPAGESPNAWGQRASQGLTERDAARLLPMPAGEAWQCNPLETDCVARWRATAAVLSAQLAEHRLFGERCRALAGRSGYQEVLSLRVDRLPQFAPLTACLRWLQIEGVLAPEAARARESLGRADALLRLVAGGAQSLIGQAVAWGGAARQQALLAQWAAGRPAGEALPAAWLDPLPARLLQPRVWMAAESAFVRQAVAGSDERPQGLGHLPGLSLQAVNAHWLEELRAYGHLQGTALAQRVLEQPEREAFSMGRDLRWRNTLGQLLADVARRGSPGIHGLRQADLVLYQTALTLAVQLNGLPAAQRAGWWARQPGEAGLRERLALQGDALVVRGWQSELQPGELQPVRFPLRADGGA